MTSQPTAPEDTVDQSDETVDPPENPAAAAVEGLRGGRVPAKAKRKRRRKPVKKATIVAHRWLSLVLGLALLVITTSGAAVVYQPEWLQWTNPDVFHVTQSAHPVTVPDAIDIVNKAHPDFKAATVVVYAGLDEVSSVDDDAHPGFWGVDPGSGRITGWTNPDAGFMAFMAQVHECFFSCDDYPGYIKGLEHPMPTLGMHWLKGVTVSGFILGVGGLLMLFLAVSGIWLWWPTLARFGNGLRIRTNKGRYARDYDLHQVVGMAAVPFLLIWGLTGASFEFHWVSTAWYAVTGGEQPKDAQSFISAPVVGTVPDLTTTQATEAAERLAHGKKLVNLFAPDADDATSTFNFYFISGLDPLAHGSAPGEYNIQVDRHNAARTYVHDYGTAATNSNRILDVWGSGMLHYGQTFNAWWRIFWFTFGLTPLVLSVTAVSTWLAKRSVKKRRKRAAAERTIVLPVAQEGSSAAASPA